MTAATDRLDAWTSRWRVRAALGVRSVLAPAVVFIPLGYLLGPDRLNLLSVGVQAHLDPLVSAALATLGLFVGLGVDGIAVDRGRPLAAAVVEALVTAAVTGAAIAWLAHRWALATMPPMPLVAAVVGVCAAASATIAARDPASPVEQASTRIADLDDLVVVVIGGLLVGHGGTVAATMRGGEIAVGIGVVMAGAGSLLFESASSDAERGVFVVGTILLLAGSAAYLGMSPLLVGAVAGALWTWAPGGAGRLVRKDLAKIQHPLIVILLLVAGAAVRPTALAAGLLAPLVVFRGSGKIAGGWAATHVVRGVGVADLGARLLPCGTVGIALALDFHQIAGGDAGRAVASAIAVAAVIFEVLAFVVTVDAEAPR